MKIKSLILSLGICGTASLAANPNYFCVQTFNVYATAYASKVDERLNRILETLGSQESCDLIGMQELWKVENFEFMAQGLKKEGYAAFGPNLKFKNAKLIGLASFSKSNFSDSLSELYITNNRDGVLDGVRELLGVEKGFTTAVVNLKGVDVLHVNTHTHPTNQAIRVAQMIQLIDAIWTQELSVPRPMVITGDLNAQPDNLELNLLKDLLLVRDIETETKKKRECTYCGNNILSWKPGRDSVFDYILVRSGQNKDWVVQDTKVNLRGTTDSPLSDHYGLRGIFSWKNNSDLLNRNNALVEQRLSRARATLGRAIRLLKAKDQETVGEALTMAQEMAKDLEKKILPEQLDTTFRLAL